MTLEPGAKVWIPCEVKLGLFPDERIVRLESPTGCWAGFVHVGELRDEIEQGRTAVLATIVELSQAEVSARLPGQTARGQYFSGPASVVEGLREA
jgi:hypothetical protein